MNSEARLVFPARTHFPRTIARWRDQSGSLVNCLTWIFERYVVNSGSGFRLSEMTLAMAALSSAAGATTSISYTLSTICRWITPVALDLRIDSSRCEEANSLFAAAVMRFDMASCRASAADRFASCQRVSVVAINGRTTNEMRMTMNGSHGSHVLKSNKFPPLVGGSCRGTRILSAEGLRPAFRANKKHPAVTAAGCGETKPNGKQGSDFNV